LVGEKGQGTVRLVKAGEENAKLIQDLPTYTRSVTASDLGKSITLLVYEETQDSNAFLTDKYTYYAFRYTIGMSKDGGLEAYLEYVSKGECGERDENGKPDFNKDTDYNSFIGKSYLHRNRDKQKTDEKAILKNVMLKIDLSADKTWLNYDGTTTPPTGAKVTFELYADGVTTGKTVTIDGAVDANLTATSTNGEWTAWKATWKGLPVYQSDADGQLVKDDQGNYVKIAYTVKETNWELPAENYASYVSDAETTPVAATSTKPATIQNKQETGELTISKSVESDVTADKTQKFEFTVTLTDESINHTFDTDVEGTNVTFTALPATWERVCSISGVCLCTPTLYAEMVSFVSG